MTLAFFNRSSRLPIKQPTIPATQVAKRYRSKEVAAVRDGMNRAAAAKIGGMDRQTLRDWVHRFNASGPGGLIDNWTEGPKPRLSAEQMALFAQIVEAGPDRSPPRSTASESWRPFSWLIALMIRSCTQAMLIVGRNLLRNALANQRHKRRWVLLARLADHIAERIIVLQRIL
jgi:Winged helix-turn helix